MLRTFHFTWYKIHERRIRRNSLWKARGGGLFSCRGEEAEKTCNWKRGKRQESKLLVLDGWGTPGTNNRQEQEDERKCWNGHRQSHKERKGQGLKGRGKCALDNVSVSAIKKIPWEKTKGISRNRNFIENGLNLLEQINIKKKNSIWTANGVRDGKHLEV